MNRLHLNRVALLNTAGKTNFVVKFVILRAPQGCVDEFVKWSGRIQMLTLREGSGSASPSRSSASAGTRSCKH